MVTKWLHKRKPNDAASVRLFCVHHAGGNALSYRNWQAYFPPDIEVCALELPGHGRRLSEEPFRQLVPLVEAACDELSPFFDRPFAFFGHSMGALISFEFAHLLHVRYGKEPKVLFLAARPAPQFADPDANAYQFSTPALIDHLHAMDGTPKELLNDPEILEMLLPTLRADYELVQTYRFSERPKLSCAIRVFGGLKDNALPKKVLELWCTATTGGFSVVMFPGDHFFVRHSEGQLLGIISRELMGLREDNSLAVSERLEDLSNSSEL
jgi:medium-chain acyl-[acyl-carrier-protein] hydrolase